MTKHTDYGLLCVAKWRDGQSAPKLAHGIVTLHDGDVTTYAYDTLGSVEAWRSWARKTFQRGGEIAIVGGDGIYSVERAPAELNERLASLCDAGDGDDAEYKRAIDEWIASVEG